MRSVETPTVLTVPAATGRAVLVERGRTFRVVDVEGGQVGDLFAFVAADPSEHVSAAHTRARLDRLFPRPGEAFVSTLRRPLLELVADDTPGVHDMLIAACDPARYAALGATGHASCAENLRTALAEHGVALDVVPQPINLFMNIPVDAGALSWRPALTRPGEGVTLRALDDLLVVLSACPQDLVEINGGRPTPLAIHLN
ncbi:hypothetical protein DSM104299_05487 [Baekduia alba]|uniref:urea carboxylase-associated family protein n=1 Tax=Baekduia alba TaxID=2997333 RepID=UPI0023416866|nr:urea carboxylase-associated family protein [Baekduia alba]WCB96721.1 hypothetical protein DSM104299_05487 [Baekduia alba]